MPAIPSCILEPLWDQMAALLPTCQVHHPLGCHRQRIPDRVIFDKLIQILVFGCGYRRIADQPVDRHKQGLKPSLATEAGGVPVTAVPAPANRRDDGRLAATLDAAATTLAIALGPLPVQPMVHLDAGYVGRLIRRAWVYYRWDTRRRRP